MCTGKAKQRIGKNSKHVMAYDIKPLALFERSFSKIPRADQERIVQKLDYLAAHPETIGAPMKHLPADLRGLHKMRVGDWRVFF